VELSPPQVEVFEEADVELLTFEEPVLPIVTKSPNKRKSDSRSQHSSGHAADSQRKQSGRRPNQTRNPTQQRQNQASKSKSKNQGQNKK